MKHLALALACALPLLGALQAQEPAEKPPLPAGPIIRPLAKEASWTVTFLAPEQPPQEPATDDARPRPVAHVIRFTKSGNVIREQETLEDGRETTRWTVDGLTVKVDGKGETAISNTGSRSAFWELAWISPTNYVGKMSVGGSDCYVFKDKVLLPMDDYPVEAAAAIDMKSQLPVLFKISGDSRVYQHGQPEAALTLPKEVTAAINARKKPIEALLGRPK